MALNLIHFLRTISFVFTVVFILLATVLNSSNYLLSASVMAVVTYTTNTIWGNDYLKILLKKLTPIFFIASVLLAVCASILYGSTSITALCLYILVVAPLSLLLIDKYPQKHNERPTDTKGVNIEIAGVFLLTILVITAHIPLINSVPFHVDEAYLSVTSEGYLHYGEFGTTISGIEYGRSQLLAALNTIFDKFSQDPKVQLRIFSLPLSATTTILVYLLAKRITRRRIDALVITSFICLNWYILLISTMARGYALSIPILLACLLLTFKMAEVVGLRNKIITASVIVFLLGLNYFEGASIGTFHLLAFLAIASPIVILKLEKGERIIPIIIGGAALAVGLLYITTIEPTHLQTIVNYLNPQLRLEYIRTFGSLLSWVNEIGLIIIASVTVSTLLMYRQNPELVLIILWFLTVIIVQGYFYGYKTFDFRYFYSVMIPILLVVFVHAIRVAHTKGLPRLLGVCIFIIAGATSIYNYSLLLKGEISWSLEKHLPWDSYLSNIPQQATLITDYPLIPHTLRPDLKLYKFVYHPQEREIINQELNMPYPRHEFKLQEIERFFEFKNDTLVKDPKILVSPQDYDIFTGAPVVMDVDHLQSILDQEDLVYTLTTYDVPKHKGRYLELYKLLYSGHIVTGGASTIQNLFDNRIHKDIVPLTLIQYENVDSK